ncbi:MAG: alginate export family protein [Candidatus Eremiobacteraeota bacterium]|nr:alginate export family protein [Candidatus Eremiobacteraeota bacterium]
MRRVLIFILLFVIIFTTPCVLHADEEKNSPVEFKVDFRSRYESKINFNFNRNKNDDTSYIGYSWKLGTLFRQKHTSEYIELHYSKKGVNRMDSIELSQAYLNYNPTKSFNARIGRQELNFGGKIMIASPPWSNIGRSYDALKLGLRNKNFKAKVFGARVTKYHSDPDDPQEYVYGLFTNTRISKLNSIDAYLFHRTKEEKGESKYQGVYAGGLRYHGKSNNFDYSLEGITQFGKVGSKDQRSYGYFINCGYRFPVKWKPRLGIQYNYASGDGNPYDDTIKTFDTFYGKKHPFCGYMDIVGMRNIKNTRLSLGFSPFRYFRGEIDYNFFTLANSRDALYNLPGNKIFEDPTGAWGNDIGREIDFTARYITGDFTLLSGCSKFYPGSAIKKIQGQADPASWVFTSLQYKFDFK